MKRFGLVALAALLGAWSYWPVTWGPQTQTVNGVKCVNLNADAGFFDAGFVYTDGGYVDGGEWDGGVCADGGLLCNSCSGTCALYTDGGFIAIDGGPRDGGWVAGAALNLTSDWVSASYQLACGCYTVANPGAAFPPDVNASFTVGLIGTPDQSPNNDGGLSAPYASSAATCVGLDGGSCQILWTQGLPALDPFSAVQTTKGGGDGGMLCCECASQ